MDVQKFRDSREAELSDFKKQYTFLKTEYSSALMSAIKEPDPQKQQELIQQVLSVNSSMATELRGILEKLNKGSQGFDPRELNDLTTDLIQYQKQYEEIEQSQDKVNTLKRIHDTAGKKLSMLTAMYNLYLGLFILLLVVVSYLVFKTEWGRKMVSTLPTTLQR